MQEENRAAMTEFRLINLSVMDEYLPEFESVDETFDSNSCPYLFEPECTDEELQQSDKWTTRFGNEIWLHAAQNKGRGREMLCMLLSET